MSKNTNQKSQTKQLKIDQGKELIIDSEDTYKDLENVFYVHPSHLKNMLDSITPNMISSVSIKNSDVKDINAYILTNLFSKVRKGTQVEVIINQPITILQNYDAKQIEANALYAGFSDVKINDITYVDDKTQNKMNTLSVSFIKADKKYSLFGNDENYGYDYNYNVNPNINDNSGNNSEINTSSVKGSKSSKKK